MSIKTHIPNSITSLNLLCGAAAIVATLLYREPVWAMVFIALAAVFDLFDGLLARVLHVSSSIGADLDSLADVVSFGLAPAILLFGFALPTTNTLLSTRVDATVLLVPSLSEVFMFAPVFLIAVFAAIRLAKFNNDTRQHTSFIGLPVPANALFWVGLSALELKYGLFDSPLLVWLILYPSILLFCYLMVSELPMFSFKVKTLRWRGNEIRYFFVIACFLLLVFLHIGGLAPIVLLYVVIAFVSAIRKPH